MGSRDAANSERVSEYAGAAQAIVSDVDGEAPEAEALGETFAESTGITDAIRAHEAGFPCISPVTKQFKKEHYDVLLEYAEEADTAYLCFDSEESGVGLDGALRTAWFLRENDVDARVAELPRGDREEKVDLAEFLRDHDGDDLRDVLDEAITPDDHPDFDDVVHSDQKPEPDDTRGGDISGSSGSEKTGSKQSALFDLSISDVVENDSRNGVQPGYRGDNPIRHVGDSHSSYFVHENYRGGMRARDFKEGYTYTPLTWLCAQLALGPPRTRAAPSMLMKYGLPGSTRRSRVSSVRPTRSPGRRASTSPGSTTSLPATSSMAQRYFVLSEEHGNPPYYCGEETDSGDRCRRRVFFPNSVCYRHE